MPESLTKQTATAEIKNKLRLLNLLVSFVIFLFLFIIFRYLRGPMSEVLDFLPDASMAVIIGIVVVLGGVGIYLSRLLSTQVVHKIEDYSDRLDSLLNITRDIRGEIYGDILLERIMDCSLSITRSDAGSILLTEDDGLVFKVVKGVKARELTGKTLPKDKGIAGWVLEHGKPLLLENAREDPRYDSSLDESTGYRTSSMLAVPLKTKSSTIGVIELLNKKQGVYDERDLDFISYLADQAAISIERARFYDDHTNYEIHLTDILLDTIDRFLPEKQGHSKRVAAYANIIAKAVDMPEHKRRRLYFASLLHDIGFMKIPQDRSFEKDVFTAHPSVGYEMLQPITFYKDIASYVLYHHERYDGYGYPEKLKGADIPLESRIIAIAEAYDSMVSKLSYRIALSHEAAVEELLRNRGGQFDAELVDLFVREVKGPLD
ncbi:MAG: HD domain-containing protein [Thermodesulfovibrionales bacterium]|nr:HD domain-containing protein [Thermodesulfovibrionales bacterium]